MVYVNITDNGVSRYPRHRHEHTEIMLYLEGEGYMYTECGDIPFSAGSIVVIPGGVLHGSVSKGGFKNISVGGDLGHMMIPDRPVCLRDTERREAERLARLLLESRGTDGLYRKSLGETYVLCLMQMMKNDAPAYSAVETTIAKIKEHAFDPHIKLAEILRESGYAEDYIRERFRMFTGLHPSAFLTRIRMERAQFLMDIYGNSQPLAKIAESCGYTDYVYFSKKFKEMIGVSPREFIKKK